MYALVLCMLLPGQTVEVPDHQVMIEEMLAHIYVSAGPEVMEKAREHFKTQSPSQVRIIYRVFLDTKAKAEEYRESAMQAQQQAVLNQAQLNLQRAQAYRDHLKREFDMTMHIKKQELEVLKSANAWMRGWGGYYPPYGHGQVRVRVWSPGRGYHYQYR